MDKKQFKQATKMIFNSFSFKVYKKYIYKDYGLYLLKIKSYKSNYSNEYYFDSYVVFKDENLDLKENLLLDDMILGSRLHSDDNSIYSFDYEKLDEETYTKQLSQIVFVLDNLVMSSPKEYLKKIKENYFNENGKRRYRNLVG